MRKALLGLVVVFFAASPALAQNPIELGADMGFVFSLTQELEGFDIPDQTRLLVPLNIRAGFFVNDNISIEPGMSVSWVKESDDGFELGTFTFMADVLYHFTTTGTSQFFVHGGGLVYMERCCGGGETESATTFGFGGGAGVKIEIVESALLRLGGRYFYLFEKDGEAAYWLPASHNIAGTIGISVLTR